MKPTTVLKILGPSTEAIHKDQILLYIAHDNAILLHGYKMRKELKQLLELKTLENIFTMVGLPRNGELLFRDVYRQWCELFSGLDINLTPDE